MNINQTKKISKQSDNEIIQSLWIGPALSAMEILCINSYQKMGHTFHLYVYDEVNGIPPGVVLKDANDIFNIPKLEKDLFGNYVNLSNTFRYHLLFEKGGWWVDMDTVCLRPFDFTDDYIFSSERSASFNRNLVSTTYIKSPPGARFLTDCISFIKKRGQEDLHWGECGVNLLSRMIFRNGLSQNIQHPDTFCPVSGNELMLFVEESDFIIPEKSYAIHFWNELWRRKGLDKNSIYPKNSLFEKLKIINTY